MLFTLKSINRGLEYIKNPKEIELYLYLVANLHFQNRYLGDLADFYFAIFV